MSEARIYKIENRLEALFGRPGGKSVREALSSAESRVRVKVAQLANTLPAATASLRELVDEAALEGEAGLDRVYEASNQVFALAGAVGFAGLADGAYSLCDLLAAFRESGRANWEAVRLRADALKLMAAKPVADQQDWAIASGLRELGAHLTRPAAGGDG